MHFVKDVTYVSEYKLLLTFEDGVVKLVDLEPYLDGEVFEPLKDIDYFKTVRVNPDINTIVWDNDADVSPDFLYEIGVKRKILPILRRYGTKKAALFGSCVRGEMTPDSDIDILVEIGKDISLLDFVGLKLEIEEVLNRKVDLGEYNTIKPFLRERIMKEQEIIL